MWKNVFHGNEVGGFRLISLQQCDQHTACFAAGRSSAPDEQVALTFCSLAGPAERGAPARVEEQSSAWQLCRETLAEVPAPPAAAAPEARPQLQNSALRTSETCMID